MADSTVILRQIVATTKHFARRFMSAGHSRLELLTVELQEERERLLQAVLMALSVAVLGLLTAMTLTAAIVVWLWPYSRLLTLIALTVLYGGTAIGLLMRLKKLLHDWHTLPASMEQLRKDRACLEELLS